MKVQNLALLLLVVGVGVIHAKENKKNTLKLRSEGILSDVAPGQESNGTIADSELKGNSSSVEKESEVASTAQSIGELVDLSAENVDKEQASSEDKVPEDEKPIAEQPKPSYMTKVKNLLKRVLDILGLSRQKRKGRKMKHGSDLLGNMRYTEEVRATVGALLGRRDCLRRAACSAGRYLREVKGKELLIVLLEKFVPLSWAEPLNHVKEAAIYKDTCDYTCLDD